VLVVRRSPADIVEHGCGLCVRHADDDEFWLTERLNADRVHPIGSRLVCGGRDRMAGPSILLDGLEMSLVVA